MKITSIPILRIKKTMANQSMHSRHGGTACATGTDPSVTNSVAIEPGGSGTATTGSNALNLIAWWDALGRQFPSIRQWAIDTLACPATSCECERAFSSAKRLITPDRNALDDDLIEAVECLKAWWDNGLVKRD